MKGLEQLLKQSTDSDMGISEKSNIDAGVLVVFERGTMNF